MDHYIARWHPKVDPWHKMTQFDQKYLTRNGQKWPSSQMGLPSQLVASTTLCKCAPFKQESDLNVPLQILGI